MKNLRDKLRRKALEQTYDQTCLNIDGIIWGTIYKKCWREICMEIDGKIHLQVLNNILDKINGKS